MPGLWSWHAHPAHPGRPAAHACWLPLPGTLPRPAAPQGGRAWPAARLHTAVCPPRSCPRPCGWRRSALAGAAKEGRRMRGGPGWQVADSPSGNCSGQAARADPCPPPPCAPHLNAGVGAVGLQLQRALIGLEGGSEAAQVLVARGQPLPAAVGSGRGGEGSRALMSTGTSRPAVRLPPRRRRPSSTAPHRQHPRASQTSALSAVWKATTPSSYRSPATSRNPERRYAQRACRGSRAWLRGAQLTCTWLGVCSGRRQRGAPAAHARQSPGTASAPCLPCRSPPAWRTGGRLRRGRSRIRAAVRRAAVQVRERERVPPSPAGRREPHAAPPRCSPTM